MPIKCENVVNVVPGRRDDPISSALGGLSLEGTTNHYTDQQERVKTTKKGQKYMHDYTDKSGRRRRKWKKDCPNPLLLALENHGANTKIANMRMEGKRMDPLPETVKKRERALAAQDGCFGKFTAKLSNGKKSSIQLNIIQIAIALQAMREFDLERHNNRENKNYFDFIGKLKDLNTMSNRTAKEYLTGYVPASAFWDFLAPSDVAGECELQEILEALQKEGSTNPNALVLHDAVLIAALSLTSSLHNKEHSAAKSVASNTIKQLPGGINPRNKAIFQGALAAVAHKHCSMLNTWDGKSSELSHKRMWTVDFVSQFPNLGLDASPYAY